MTSASRVVCGLGLSLLLVSPSSAQQNRFNDPAVEAFYPQRLVDEWNELFTALPRPLQRTSTSADIDLNKTGTAGYVVVAFSNGLFNAAVLLRKTASGLTKISEPVIPIIAGSWSKIEGSDVDGDGKPEVILDVSIGANIGKWILKWDGVTCWRNFGRPLMSFTRKAV